MTLSVPESVISIYIEKRRQLLYEVTPLMYSFFAYSKSVITGRSLVLRFGLCIMK